MSDFRETNSPANAHADSPLHWLANYQQQHREFNFPAKKDELWKYTSLRVLEQGDFLSRKAEPVRSGTQLSESFAIEGLESIDLVFVNGQFAADLSYQGSLPEGLQLVRFSQADAQQQDEIAELLQQIASNRSASQVQQTFYSLNAQDFDEGLYIKIKKNCAIKTPLRIVQLSVAQTENSHALARLLVNLEAGAEACVVEHFVTNRAAQNFRASVFVNSVSEFSLQANATLQHYRLHLEDETAVHVGACDIYLDRSARVSSFNLAFGSQLTRVDLSVHHQGEGAHADLQGIYLPHLTQHVDYHTCIEHKVPHCTSNEVFRGIVGDSACAVFNGRIHIHKHAQKTAAQLSNKNLLTSNKAEVDSKPELEIYADDVQCAHGATVAQLDEGACHYLMTRGISREEARTMLSFGFINELVNHIPHASLANYLRPQLAKLFARDAELLRHIG